MAFQDFIESGAYARWQEVAKEHNITTAVQAELQGVSRATIVRWNDTTSGNIAPTDALMRFCVRFDVSPTWLLFGKGPKRLSTFGSPRAGMVDEIKSRAGKISRDFDELIRDMTDF